MQNMEFAAPGPGVWELEQTHFSRPVTRYAAQMFPEALARGFGEGTRRYGLLLDTLKLRFVNDFAYAKFCPVGAPEGAKGPPPRLIFKLITWLHPEIRRRIKSSPLVFEQKLWREDLRRWDEHYKPDSIARNTRLQRVGLEKLGDTELIGHLNEVRDNAIEMVYRHHIFTIPSSFPVGHFIVEGMRMTGLPSGELLVLLKGCAPISRGVAASELADIGSALGQNGFSPDSLRGKPPRQALDELTSRGDALGEAVRKFVESVGYRLISGYDLCEQYALELPEMLVRTICSARSGADTRQAEFEKRREVIRAKVAQPERARFDEILEEARLIHRLRDERGMYNDLWSTGLARRALLEAGRRLTENGALPTPGLAVFASHDEVTGLLKGEKQPDAAELNRRRQWRETKTIADAPPFLGGEPSGPPPAEWLPAKARPNARAVDAVIRGIFEVSERQGSARSVEGLSVHPGVYEGPARIVHGAQDFDRLQRGDVLVARNTGPAFNIVLPLLGAIVTDRGGQLSHAAIVAREYGIPAVVGTREATTRIADGARIRVNGDTGIVEML